MTGEEVTMSWHVDQRLFEAYRQGGLSPSRVMAVDAHLQTCAACRAAVPADDAWRERSWSAISDALDAQPGGLGERLLGGSRLRLLTATPAARRSWAAATAAVLAFGVAAAIIGQTGARTTLLIYLVFAPVLPVLAVATVYGPPVDPMHEITSATPMAGPALVLWRATAVVGLAMALGLAGAVFLPGPGVWAVAWLLPALLLCVSTLALGTALRLPTAAAVFGVVWLVTVGGAVVAGSRVQPLLFGPAAQAAYLAAALLAGLVLAVRRYRLDPGEMR